MKINKLKSQIITAVIFFAAHGLIAQFTFGVTGALSLTQIEKDNLRGFNNVGFESGLIGGYKINDSQSILVEMKYSRFGSCLLYTSPSPRDRG